jgi:hypothetical protein
MHRIGPDAALRRLGRSAADAIGWSASVGRFAVLDRAVTTNAASASVWRVVALRRSSWIAHVGAPSRGVRVTPDGIWMLATATGLAAGPESIDVFILTTTLFGGLALFLLGLDHLTESLRLVAGSRMRSVLGALTRNRLVGMLTGAG